MTVKRQTSIAEYGILLLAPAIAALAVIILLGLLGFFVVWLIVFWLLAADDIRDATSTSDEMGKPAGRDVALGRPSAVRELGLDGALHRLEHIVEGTVEAIPACPGINELGALIRLEARRLVPAKLAQRAA